MVTGRLERGKLKKNEIVRSIGYGIEWSAPITGMTHRQLRNNVFHNIKSTGIETYHKTVDVAEAGDQLGLLIKGVNRDQVRRGLCLVPEKSDAKGWKRCEAKVGFSCLLFEKASEKMCLVFEGIYVKTERRWF